MNTWSLENLYPGFESPKYQNDIHNLGVLIEKYIDLTSNIDTTKPKETLINLLEINIELASLSSLIYSFISLTLATDTINEIANNQLVAINKMMLKTTLPSTMFERFITSIDDLDSLINQDPLLKEHEFFIKEIKSSGKYLLSNNEEVLASRLRQSGSSMWQKLFNTLTSTLEVEYQNEVISLSEVRNLAYDANPEVRKDAYYAELESYKKIDKSIAFCLNGIKNEVITMADIRGYQDPLDLTLQEARLDKNVLDALLQSIQEYLPIFHMYLKRKAEILGHKDGLPFYDLFAPIGSSHKVYSISEAQEFILKHFASFSDDLKELAEKAFENNWIDYLPKLKKRGGAFCAKVHPIKESRILTNYNGSIGDIITIAHELGHAYHNHNIFDESILNSRYSASIAETASVLCETIVKTAAISEASSDVEKLAILEQELQDSTQVIVDIYSRFLFESKVFILCENELLNEKRLYKLMEEAQIASYGESLNPNFLNPGMWINKSHYYSSGLSFYNFPYAFGLLFSKGIYAQYLEKGPSFTENIKLLLANTGKMTISEVAHSIGIDITDLAFWRSSLDLIKGDIEMFLDLTKEMI